MKTRRSFMQILLSLIPASLLGGIALGEPRKSCSYKENTDITGEKFPDAEAAAFKKYYDETEINAKPVWLGRNDKFYDQYVDTATGKLVDGNDIRLFLDWTPFHPEQPRYVRMRYESLPLTSNQFPRGSRAVITTYLDSELEPVLTRGAMPTRFVKMPSIPFTEYK